MDYEKKYNEALDRAREIKSKILSSHLSTESCKAVSEYIDTIIPELAESEDERIRKGLSKFLWDVANGEVKSMPSASQCQEWLSYLEKQKDINCLACDEHLKGYLAGRKVTEEEQKKPNIELIQKSWYMEGYHDRIFDFEPMWIIKTGEEGPRYEKNPNYGKPLPKEQKPGTTQDNPIDPFDTKLFQDGVKEGRRLEREDMQKEPFSCGHENGSSEEPVLPGIEEPGIPGKDFIPAEWVEACEKYGKWKIVKQEQPELNIDTIRDWSIRFTPDIRQEVEATAYHFGIWHLTQ